MIYIECKPDYVLINSLTKFPRKEIVHEFKGKFEVCKRLETNKNSKGLIDEDPYSVQPKYLARTELKEVVHDIKVLYDSSNDNYLIVLCPRLEEWVLQAAQIAKVDVRKYDLPNDARKLHEVININLEKFEKLLEDLRESSIALKTLKGLLRK
jgi:hypothetical protein